MTCAVRLCAAPKLHCGLALQFAFEKQTVPPQAVIPNKEMPFGLTKKGSYTLCNYIMHPLAVLLLGCVASMPAWQSIGVHTERMVTASFTPRKCAVANALPPSAVSADTHHCSRHAAGGLGSTTCCSSSPVSLGASSWRAYRRVLPIKRHVSLFWNSSALNSLVAKAGFFVAVTVKRYRYGQQRHSGRPLFAPLV